MKVSKILINHMTEPIGFELKDLRIEFTVTASKFSTCQKKLVITENNQEVYNSGYITYNNNYFSPKFMLKSRTRYYVTVFVKNQREEVSMHSFFETGKMDELYTAKWLGNANKNLQNTIFKKDFSLNKSVSSARLYATGLGLYEAYLDNKKIGSEYLAPGLTNYNDCIQVQTYDVTSSLKTNTTHQLMFSLGDGWYKGNMGFDGGKDNIYGDQQRMLAELHLTFTDGTHEVISTDESWLTTSGQVTKSAIYYGEDLDANRKTTDWQPVVVLDYPKDVLCDRLSLPLVISEYLPVKNIINTPAGETVLDFGQNQAGWMEFYNREAKGTVVTFEVGEILQKGNFYRDNLRLARATFKYVSDGKEGWVRPHFTYYGYRYVRVTGIKHPLNKDDFKAAVIHSKMNQTGAIVTDNPKVNRLFQNILWSQKSNFFDVPTDCPQRDERLGWTGDANIFSNTAALNMNVFEFFKKYARDIAVEQKHHNGMTTMYAPALGDNDGGASVWGDAATIIPWNMYKMYGDEAILRQNYDAMRSWVEWIGKTTKKTNLFSGGSFQFGDWLALDGENSNLPTGKTDEDFIASVYYYYSTLIVSKTAKILNHINDAAVYAAKAKQIKKAILNEYITANGRLSIDTQTAYALALYFKLVPQGQVKRVLNDLISRLNKDDDHLKTGFVGTPFVCQVLSKYGAHKLATKIFMNEDYPSWLYAVNLGATTVWERWNSVLEDGSMNPEGMNSLNHYSIGAIMEWAYCYLLGYASHTPGFKEVTFEPNFDYHLKQVSGYHVSSYGKLKTEYQIESDKKHTIKLHVEVPFGQTVHIKLPRSNKYGVMVNGNHYENGNFELKCGKYEINYIPDHDYIERYSVDTPVASIMKDKLLVTKISKISDVLNFFEDPKKIESLGKMSLSKLNFIMPFINIKPDELRKINSILRTTPVLSERKTFKL